jgi:hypothetical protein
MDYLQRPVLEMHCDDLQIYEHDIWYRIPWNKTVYASDSIGEDSIYWDEEWLHFHVNEYEVPEKKEDTWRKTYFVNVIINVRARNNEKEDYRNLEDSTSVKIFCEAGARVPGRNIYSAKAQSKNGVYLYPDPKPLIPVDPTIGGVAANTGFSSVSAIMTIRPSGDSIIIPVMCHNGPKRHRPIPWKQVHVQDCTVRIFELDALAGDFYAPYHKGN